MEQTQTDLPSDRPIFSPLSRTNSELSDYSSVPSEAGESNSSQLEQTQQSDRAPTAADLANDNWRYIREFFVMTQTPSGKSRNCAYQCKLCVPKFREVKASKTTYDALKNHMKKDHPSREREFRALISTNVNHNKRRRDSEGNGSSPADQPKIKDYRGTQWGKPGQLVSKQQMNDDLVDLFVEGMLPMVVSASKLCHYCVQSPPPPIVQACFWE